MPQMEWKFDWLVLVLSSTEVLKGYDENTELFKFPLYNFFFPLSWKIFLACVLQMCIF